MSDNIDIDIEKLDLLRTDFENPNRVNKPEPFSPTLSEIQKYQDIESNLKVHQSRTVAKCWDLISDYRRRMVLCFVVTIILVVMVVVISRNMVSSSKTIPDSMSIQKLEYRSFTTEPIPTSTLPEKPSKMILVNSFRELNSINDFVQVVRIKSLEDTIDNPIKKNDNVQALMVDATISEDVLIQILENYKNIQNLTLDVGQLCSGATHADIRDLQTLNLRNIEYLKLVNCIECPIVEWILKSKTKQLKRFALCESSISKRMFDLMEAFLSQTDGIVLEDLMGNQFCPECNFTDDDKRFVIAKNNFADPPKTCFCTEN